MFAEPYRSETSASLFLILAEIFTAWWLSPTPLKNIRVEWDDFLPSIWKNQRHVPKHQPVHVHVYVHGFGRVDHLTFPDFH